jgi:hypothetical protein
LSVDFKNGNLPLYQNAPKNVISEKNEIFRDFIISEQKRIIGGADFGFFGFSTGG